VNRRLHLLVEQRGFQLRRGLVPDQAACGDGPDRALEPGEPLLAEHDAFAQARHALAADAELVAVREEHAVGAVGIVDVARVEDADRHGGTVATRDLAQPRRALVRAGLGLVDLEPCLGADGDEVEDGAETVGAIAGLEAALEPQAAVATADAGARGVNAAAAAEARGFPGAALLGAGRAAELVERVHAQDGAAQRAAAARALGLPGRLLACARHVSTGSA